MKRREATETEGSNCNNSSVLALIVFVGCHIRVSNLMTPYGIIMLNVSITNKTTTVHF